MNNTPELPTNYDPLAEKKGVRAWDSVSMESPEFNALRKELFEHWQDEPSTEEFGGRTLWWYSGLMVFHPVAFVEICNLELRIDPPIVFDSFKQPEICLRILNACRARRGLSPLSSDNNVIEVKP